VSVQIKEGLAGTRFWPLATRLYPGGRGVSLGGRRAARRRDPGRALHGQRTLECGLAAQRTPFLIAALDQLVYRDVLQLGEGLGHVGLDVIDSVVYVAMGPTHRFGDDGIDQTEPV